VKRGFPALVLGFLALGVLGGVAFGGGVLYGRSNAPVSKATAVAAAPAAGSATALAAAGGRTPGPGAGGGAAGGAGGGGAAAAGGIGAGFTAGAISSINGNTLVLTTATGATTNVQLSPSTRVETTVAGTTADLKPGSVICVQGSNDAGVVTANTVSIAPSCASLLISTAAGGGAGGQRGGAAGTGTPSAGGGPQRPAGQPTPTR
jgi:hypothetical protein